MASYAFRTITAGQALAIQPADSISLGDIPLTSVTVLYSPGSITILAGGRTIEFPLAISDLSIAGNLTGIDGSHLFIGGAGNDTASLTRTGADDPRRHALFGGAGDDNLDAGGLGLLQGNQGNDTLAGGSTIYGGQDNDLIRAAGFAQGNKGDDNIQGATGVDTLLGGQGSDTIDGGGGLDFLNGNLGDDHVRGAGQLFGEGGDDRLDLNVSGTSSTLDGGAGNDYLTALQNGGVIHLVGGDGDDTVSSSMDGAVTVLGGAGDDRLSLHEHAIKFVDGGDGNDWIQVDSGVAQAFGGAGDDTITMAYPMNFSTLSGGDGNDVLSGGEFVTVDGGAGNDTLFGAAMTGGGGSDAFGLSWIGDPSVPNGARALDWSADDKILLATSIDRNHVLYSEATAATFGGACALFQQSGYGNHVMAIQVGADVIVFAAGDSTPGFDETDAVFLVGRTLADIDATKLV